MKGRVLPKAATPSQGDVVPAWAPGRWLQLPRVPAGQPLEGKAPDAGGKGPKQVSSSWEASLHPFT